MDSTIFDRICAIIRRNSRSETESGRLELLKEVYGTEPVPIVLQDCCRNRRDEFASCITRQAQGFSLSDGQNVLVRLLGILRRDFGTQDQTEVDALVALLDGGQKPASETVLLPGKYDRGHVIAGRYKLIDPIGDESGQAKVWKAIDTKDPEGLPVVVKLFKPHPTRDYKARFLEEVRSVRDLQYGPNIIRIYDFGEEGATPYLVMPVMSGSLKGRIAGPTVPDQVLIYLNQIASALDYAHQHGVIHRDLKPANFLFTPETDQLCVADFGISFRTKRKVAVTGTGETAATEEYAAPEQLRNEEATARTDIYALAIIAYELLTGELPFKGTKAELNTAHLTQELPENPNFPPFVLDVLRQGAAKDPAKRPATAAEFVKLLKDALAGKAPAAIEHYLNKILPGHILEPGSIKNLERLDIAYVPPAADVRVQMDRGSEPDPILDNPVLDDEDVVVDFGDEEDLAPPSVELPVAVYLPRESAEYGDPTYEPDARASLKTLKRVVLLGEPGAGKTFTLARLALDYAAEYRSEPTGPLPVFVPLSMYNTATNFEDFIAERLKPLPYQELKIIWLLDALNEMPREQGQLKHVQDFIHQLVAADLPFVLSCRVRNYEDELRDVQGLHRVDLQDLNPQQIFEILAHFVPRHYAEQVWAGVMHGVFQGEDGKTTNLLDSWGDWGGTAKDFWGGTANDLWDRSKGWNWYQYKEARNHIHADPRKLLLLCRNPFSLVKLVVPRIRAAVKEANQSRRDLATLLDAALPRSRAKLFEMVTDGMLDAEAKRGKWLPEVPRVKAALEFTAAALQATEQRTELPLADLPPAPEALGGDLIELLKVGRDAGLVSLTETSVRFNHQLFQEYFATKRLRDLLATYEERHPGWYEGPALPAPDENLAELFPNWWDAGGWAVTVALLGEVEGATWISRVVRWLASYAPEIALQAVLDNNDGRKVTDLTPEAKQALIDGAWMRSTEENPIGRAAAYRVLGHPDIDADQRPGVGTYVRADGVKLPDIDWVHIPAGDFSYQKGTKRLDYDFWIARYPITYAQFQTFIDAPDGFTNPRWWDGLANDLLRRKNQSSPPKQRFEFRNHPRENVNWYDAMAFCRWLSWQMGGSIDLTKIDEWTVRLPTEMEWEKAARAQTGWDYPWGPKYLEGHANIDETYQKAGTYYLRKTSAVGIYPQGDARHWKQPISDLSGNVWEWCLTDRNNPSDSATGENLSSKSLRVLRGGSWDYDQVAARAVYRDTFDEYFRFYLNIGFRMILVRPPSP